MARSKHEVGSHLVIRKQLAEYLIDYIKVKKLKQTEAAKMLDVQQPRISDLMRMQVQLFSIDTLVGFLSKLDPPRRVEFEVIRVIRSRRVRHRKVRKTRQIHLTKTPNVVKEEPVRTLPMHETTDAPTVPETQPSPETPYREETSEIARAPYLPPSETALAKSEMEESHASAAEN